MKKLFIIMVPLFVVIFAFAQGARCASEEPVLVTDPVDAVIKGSIIVKGEGAAPADRPLSPGQKRILALRAAKVVAVREAAEVLNGMSVSGETTVMSAATQSDAVRSTVQGIVRGAQVIKEAYDPLSEIAVVFVSVPLTGPNGVYARLLPQVIPAVLTGPAYQPSVVMAPPSDRDGLILDVTELPFRPALINRVLAENGEVIYDPTKVAQNILVERGAAEYTNDVGKARALLGERGAQNPLVVRAVSVVKNTDVVVSPDNAGEIFTSNQKKNYLEGAKVVFVLR